MLSPIPEILDELRAGRIIVLVDDESRENEGDMVCAAELVTPETINFMLTEARGYLCLSLTGADCERLGLAPQSQVNTSVRGTPFTVTFDGHPRHGFTTGVSAQERARAIQMAVDPSSAPGDFVKPGHINPLRARDGGCLVRTGQTEGSVDLCRLAGLRPAAVILEIMRPDGEMARMPDLEQVCARHTLKMCSVAQVIEHRLSRETLVRRMEPVGGAPLDTVYGPFDLIAFESVVDALPHVALTLGGVGRLGDDGRPVHTDEPTLVRVHRRDLLGDVFGAVRNPAQGPSRAALEASMRRIREAGRGAVVYLRPEGVGEALDQRLQTIRRGGVVDPDRPDLTDPSGLASASGSTAWRELGIGSQILRELGLSKLRLMTDHPKSLPGLEAYGLEVVEHVPLTAGE